MSQEQLRVYRVKTPDLPRATARINRSFGARVTRVHFNDEVSMVAVEFDHSTSVMYFEGEKFDFIMAEEPKP